MLKQPYIGVTGIMRAEDANTLACTLISSEYMLMAGILVSERTLLGRPANPRVANRYPPVQHIDTITKGINDSRVLKLIHYSGRAEVFGEDLVTMHNRWGKGDHRIDGFQFNMAWPDMAVLDSYRLDIGHEKTLVLQVGTRAMEMVNNSPKEMVKRLQGYPRGLFDAVLVDPSGGMGVPFDPVTMTAYLNEIFDADLGLSMIAAGGLGPNSLDHLYELKGQVDPGVLLSVDAEGALMGEEGGLDLHASTNYLVEAQNILLS